ncbi:MAG: carboxypeptidase-like regulatory domain-containing protein [Myxococcales bacterium]|nr:carboxypeptidase-like regulatory domain-containing protein [Myxococcales bacterium]
MTESSAASKPATEPKTAAADTVLEGVVKLASGVELPSWQPAQMLRQVLQHAETAGAWPESCTPPKSEDRQPVRATAEGGLSGVVVAVSGFSKPASRPPMVHELTIDDCRLSPSTVVAMVGDRVQVKNTVDYPFMPSQDQEGVIKTLTRGQVYEFAMEKPGVVPVRCGFTAPCARTDIVTLTHRLGVVTDGQGAFRIEGFPVGEKVRLSAWHPLFAEASLEVQLTAGEHKRVELELRPQVQVAPATEPAAAAVAASADAKTPAAKQADAVQRPE